LPNVLSSVMSRVRSDGIGEANMPDVTLSYDNWFLTLAISKAAPKTGQKDVPGKKLVVSSYS